MRAFARRFFEDCGAAIAPTLALSLTGLVAVGGLAYDYSRMVTLDTELQNAADQAALAAATQLDGRTGACARASAAAAALVANQTRMATDSGGLAVTVTAEATCDAVGNIRFWQNAAGTTAADSDANAKYVDIGVNTRRADYALTPIVAVLSSGNMTARAMAGLGQSVCQTPPLMLCNPTPGVIWNPTTNRGRGVVAVAHQNGQSWSPGNFGFLDVGTGSNGAPDLLAAMAYQDAALTCQSLATGQVDTGATSPAIDAANTRFDIYNFGSGGGSTLGACHSGACPPAANVTKDLVRPENASGNNSCKIHNSGWQLPAEPFSPRPAQTGDTTMTQIDQNSQISAMGLPRDNCHYTTFGAVCPGGRFGNGEWARGDYFNKYHSGRIPAGASTMTRYDVYRWEISNGFIPDDSSGALRQHGSPICSASHGSGTLDPSRDRRVFTVAIANNCANLSGGSVPVQIDQWVEMFFVEPGIARPNVGVTADEIYLEVIGPGQSGGSAASSAQTIMRSTPYLVR